MNFGGNGTANHHKNFTPWNKGKKNYFSAETLEKIRSGRRGKHFIFTEEHKRHMSESQRGRVFTEEHKKKLSAARKGKTISEEHRMKLSEASRKVCSKPVLMYDRSGNFVMEFPSLKAVADHIGVNQSQVSAVLRGKHKTAAGYTFRYKNENPDR